MAKDTDRDLPTTGIIKGKTTTLPTGPRGYHVPGGPKARNLGKTTIKILSEFERGDGNRDRNAGR
jgi:hypothetical protein